MNLTKSQQPKRPAPIKMPPFLASVIKISTLAQILKALQLSASECAAFVGATEPAASIWYTGKGNPDPHNQILLHCFASNKLEAFREAFARPDYAQKMEEWVKRNRVKLEPSWQQRIAKSIKATTELVNEHALQISIFHPGDTAKAAQRAIELGHIKNLTRIETLSKLLSIDKADQLQTLKALMLAEHLEREARPMIEYVGNMKQGKVEAMVFKVSRPEETKKP